MTNIEKIVSSLNKNGRMCDDCLSSASMVKPRQTVNIQCRSLEKQNVLVRQKDLCPRCRVEKIVNELSTKDANVHREPSAKSFQRLRDVVTVKKENNHDLEALSEDEIKKVLSDWLEKDGWKVNVAWGHIPGIDVDATKEDGRWIIEAKGPGSRQPMRVNYFIGILGETLQRMSDANAKYSIALPDLQQYRRLWEKLPTLAKERTKISILFVSIDGIIEELK